MKARFEAAKRITDSVAIVSVGAAMSSLLYLCWQVGSGHV